MQATEITQLSLAGSTAAPMPAPSHGRPGSDSRLEHQRCDECGAAVAAEQRYCVVCGAHRRTVDDPAARYLSQASARARRSGRSAGRARVGGRAVGVGTALVLAAVPVAAGVGVLAGRASNNSDGALSQALAHQAAAESALGQAISQHGGSAAAATSTTATSTAATGAPAATSTTSHVARSRTTKHGHASAAARSATSSSGGATGGGSQLTTSKPSQSQVQQGASAVQKIQKSAGKSYVNSQSGLPGTIVVP